MALSDSDLRDAIDTVISEAVGGGPEAMRAVAWAIANRARVRGQSIGDVVRAANQFAGYYAPGSGTLSERRDQQTRQLVEGFLREAESGQGTDPTNGADHFAKTGTSPGWTRSMSQSGDIGGNTFYRSSDAVQSIAPPVPQYRPETAEQALAAISSAGSSTPNTMFNYAYGPGTLRNLPVEDHLSQSIQDSVSRVYGPGYEVRVISGAQGEDSRGITGSRRHTTGTAADIFVYDPNGNKLSSDQLLPLAQHWRASGIGSVGFPANGQSMHLDLVGGAGPGSIPLGPGEAPVWFYGQPSSQVASLLRNSVAPEYYSPPNGPSPGGPLSLPKEPIDLPTPPSWAGSGQPYDINVESPQGNTLYQDYPQNYYDGDRANLQPPTPMMRPGTPAPPSVVDQSFAALGMPSLPMPETPDYGSIYRQTTQPDYASIYRQTRGPQQPTLMAAAQPSSGQSVMRPTSSPAPVMATGNMSGPNAADIISAFNSGAPGAKQAARATLMRAAQTGQQIPGLPEVRPQRYFENNTWKTGYNAAR